MAVREPIPIPFDFVVLCRRSAPLPLAYMDIECALCTHVGFKKGILAVMIKKVGHLNTCSLNCVILNQAQSRRS